MPMPVRISEPSLTEQITGGFQSSLRPLSQPFFAAMLAQEVHAYQPTFSDLYPKPGPGPSPAATGIEGNNLDTYM